MTAWLIWPLTGLTSWLQLQVDWYNTLTWSNNSNWSWTDRQMDMLDYRDAIASEKWKISMSFRILWWEMGSCPCGTMSKIKFFHTAILGAFLRYPIQLAGWHWICLHIVTLIYDLLRLFHNFCSCRCRTLSKISTENYGRIQNNNRIFLFTVLCFIECILFTCVYIKIFLLWLLWLCIYFIWSFYYMSSDECVFMPYLWLLWFSDCIRYIWSSYLVCLCSIFDYLSWIIVLLYLMHSIILFILWILFNSWIVSSDVYLLPQLRFSFCK